MALRSLGLAAAVMLAVASIASAKDPVAGGSGPRAPADGCCIEVTQLPPIETSSALAAPGIPGHHAVAGSEARLGLDGADWNCRRPDGSQRCVSELLNHR
jgi:hypothetical protein